MGSNLYHVIFWLALLYSPTSSQDPDLQPRPIPRGWKSDTYSDLSSRCKQIKPTPRDVVRRIYAVLPYFDRDHQNAKLLHRYRTTINELSESMDLVDREAAFYAAVLTPIIYLQRYNDAKCLLERFLQVLDEFPTYPPSEKRNAIKNLQNLRDISHKIHVLIRSLPDKRPPTRTPSPEPPDDEEVRDKKDIRFLKELIKNLG